MLNHVLLHQTVIGEEALLQLAKVGETPDVLVGCTGGGSNFGGLAFPFLREKLAGRMDPTIRCVEPAACPSLTKGEYRYDFGDTAGMTPLLKMHTLGHGFIPEPIHAGGLRYHGMAPLVSHLYDQGLVEAVAIPQRECFAAALQFARTEGIVPAPEPTHALAAAIREALACKEAGESKVILTALCGHGHLDLAAYEQYLSGEMVDYELPDAEIAAAMADVPGARLSRRSADAADPASRGRRPASSTCACAGGVVTHVGARAGRAPTSSSTPPAARCCPGCTTTTSTCWRWPRRGSRSASARRTSAIAPPFDAALRAAAPRRRAGCAAIGYHESVAGPLDRDRLDALVPGRPVRVQHRSGRDVGAQQRRPGGHRAR